MRKERETPDDLFSFAQMLVAKLKRTDPLQQWSKHQEEDAVQDLFLAGWQVWQDEGNAGLAKNRMADRAKNLIRDLKSERKHEPTAAGEQRMAGVTGRWDESSDDESLQRFDPVDRDSLRGAPDQDSLVNETLNRLTERQREIAVLRMAGFSNDEIATELNIGLRTVERELQHIKKDISYDDAK